jgi:hypothetical protein
VRQLRAATNGTSRRRGAESVGHGNGAVRALTGRTRSRSNPLFKTAAAAVHRLAPADGAPAPAPTTTASAPVTGSLPPTSGGPDAEAGELLPAGGQA